MMGTAGLEGTTMNLGRGVRTRIYCSIYTKLFYFSPITKTASLVAQMVKNLPAIQENWV